MIILLVGIIAFVCGLVAGGALASALMIITGGSPDASADRNDLIEILTTEFAIEERAALRILQRGLNPWSQWRAKTRPILWTFGMDWPEFTPTRLVEFSDYYERGLSGVIQRPDTSGEPETESEEDYQGALLPPTLEPEMISDTMQDSNDDSY